VSVLDSSAAISPPIPYEDVLAPSHTAASSTMEEVHNGQLCGSTFSRRLHDHTQNEPVSAFRRGCQRYRDASIARVSGVMVWGLVM